MRTTGIMIRRWDLTMAANNCQGGMKVMYGEVDAQEVGRSRCGQIVGRKVGLVQQRMLSSCTVNRQSRAHGREGFKGPCVRGG